MNKKEFLDILYEQLSGQMPEGNVAAHVLYYRNYIEDAVTQGRTETEVLNELGDPRLIARTLLDTDSTASGNPQTTGSYSEPYTDNSYEYDNSSSGSKKVKSRSFHIDLSTWYACRYPDCCGRDLPLMHSTKRSDPGHGHFRYRMLYNIQTAQLICKNIKKECKS